MVAVEPKCCPLCKLAVLPVRTLGAVMWSINCRMKLPWIHTHTHTHTHEKFCLELAFEGRESSRVPDVLGEIVPDVRAKV